MKHWICGALAVLVMMSACAEGQMDTLYKQGVTVYQSDPAAAYRIFAEAAGAGHVSAMVGAGHCCETGAGTTVDYAAAIEWYGRAVEHNALKACEGLARIYASCDDPEFHDGEKAVKFAAAVIRKKPRDADALALLASAHARNMDFERAEKAAAERLRYNRDLNAVDRLKALRAAYGLGTPFPPCGDRGLDL